MPSDELPRPEPAQPDRAQPKPAQPSISPPDAPVPDSVAAATENPLREALVDQPRWLHPLSPVFEVLSHIRSMVLPFLLALFGAAQDELFWQIFAFIILILSLVRTILHFLTLRYRITGNDLVINSGLFFRRVRTIPIRKIQNLDLIQSPLHRLFKVAEVRIETASGAEADGILRVLGLSDVEHLRAALFPERAEATLAEEPGPGEGQASALDVETRSNSGTADQRVGKREGARVEELLRVPLGWLALAGLSSDRGLLLFGVAFGALFQFEKWFENRAMWRLVSQYASTWTTVAVVLVVGWLLLKLLSIAWFTIRFFDYRLTRVGDDLRLASGLFTRVSATIPRQRIQCISVHRPLLFRWAGYSTIKLETAGGWGQGGEGGATTATRSWFVPVVPNREVPRLLAELRPGLQWQEAEQPWQPVSPRAGVRLIRIALIVASLLTCAAAVGSWPWGGLAGLLFFPALIFWAIKKGKSHSYARTGFGVAYRSGLLTRKLSLTFYERIQSVKLKQSPFDRRWRMAVLEIDTAAAGPADHELKIPLLDAEFARREFELLRQRIAGKQHSASPPRPQPESAATLAEGVDQLTTAVPSSP